VILSDEDDMPGTGVVAPARTADGRRRQSLLPFVESFLRTRRDADDWSVSLDGLWCRVSPVDHQPREQGWKLHVAATAASAGAVLRRSLPVLLDARPAFKFASSIEDIANLNGPHYPREGSGKFITVYPDDDEQLTELAERLHRATAGQPAPAILSDRRWRADSTVHVRFGAFSGRMSISNDGEYQSMLLDPRGELVRDRREPRFTPPPWVDSPFTAPRSAARPGGSVTLGGWRGLARRRKASTPRPAAGHGERVLVGREDLTRDLRRGGALPHSKPSYQAPGRTGPVPVGPLCRRSSSHARRSRSSPVLPIELV
jgi:hypothetical protein